MTNSNNFFELIEWLQKNVDWLNLVLIGGEADSALIDGVEKPSIDKRFADRFAALQAMVKGRQSFGTKAAMNADLNHPENTVAEVWNDPVPANNGLYGKLGENGSGSWLQASFDTANTAMQMAKVNESELVRISKVGKNLFDKSAAYQGYYDNSDSYNSDSVYQTSNDIEIGSGSYRTNINVVFCHYLEFPGGPSVRVVNNTQTIALSGSEKYVRMSFGTSDLGSLQLEKGTTSTAYESYRREAAESFYFDVSRILDIASLFDDRPAFIRGKNIINVNDLIDGEYLGSDGNVKFDQNYSRTKFIPVSAGTKYVFSHTLEFTHYFDGNQQFIRKEPINFPVVFSTPANCRYVVVSGSSFRFVEKLQLEAGETSTEFEPFRQKAEEVKIHYDNILDADKNVAKAVLGQGFAIRSPQVNLYDYERRTDGYYCSRAGDVLIAHEDYSTSDYIDVQENTRYSYSINNSINPFGVDFMHFYDADRKFISAPQENKQSFITPVNCAYVRFSGNITTMSLYHGVQLNIGEFKWQQPYRNVVKTDQLPVNPLMEIEPDYTIITANSDPNSGADFTGRRGLQDAIDSITDATIGNQYLIEATGIFEATQPAHFDVLGGSAANFISAKDFVNVQGKGMFVIIGTLDTPDSWYNTVLWNANSWLMDCEVIAQNNRYAVHIEGAGFGNRNMKRKFTRVKMRSNGWIPLGYGKSTGEVLLLEGCELEAFGDTKGCLFVHTNGEFPERTLVRCIDTNFITNGGSYLHAQNLGDGWHNTVQLENCTVDGHLEYSARHNSDYDDDPDTSKMDVQVKGLDPTPFHMYLNKYDGIETVIKIQSHSVGVNSTVRVTGGTAFDDIFGKLSQKANYQDKYGRSAVNGYSYLDGNLGVYGYCLSGIDLHEYPIAVHRKSIGKRLGDCTAANKTLTVVVDGGATQTITFNKNYDGTGSSIPASYTNYQIISEINAQLTGATASMYAYGQDYFPSFTGVKKMCNGGSTPIRAGAGVVFTSLTHCRLARNSDQRIDGVAMDDAGYTQYVRVVTKGRVFSQSKNTRYSTRDGGSIYPYGVGLGISSEVDGDFDENASPKVLRSLGDHVMEIIR